jgi:predicted dehydrogenase
MKIKIPRRRFLQKSLAASAAIAAFESFPYIRAAESPANKVVFGVVGLGRGSDHVRALLQIPGVEIAYVADVDRRRLETGAALVKKTSGQDKVKAVTDFRRILEDKDVDALSIATCNHWHAPATILACAAGKHVYVEKPASHNPREGEWMVEAARKYNRKLQMGNQRRSWPGIIAGIEKLKAGALGRVFCARCWYVNARGSIKRGQPAPVPEWLDYSLWQGPAPERPYVDNLVHYNWHWRWHWGNGELGNNGVHALDLARWGLGVDAPRRVTYGGGRYHFDDDQETPDTGVATFDFGNCFATWEHSSCHPRSAEKLPIAAFYGEKGTLFLDGNGYRICDAKGNEIEKETGPGGDKIHFENFVNAIRKGEKLNSEIEEGQKSTLLCHLGNMAWRLGRTINYDAQKRQVPNDPDAMKLWEREYRPGWKPKV